MPEAGYRDRLMAITPVLEHHDGLGMGRNTANKSCPLVTEIVARLTVDNYVLSIAWACSPVLYGKLRFVRELTPKGTFSF